VRFENKVAIVTGGGQGIGFGIAEAFAREGARVVLAQRNRERADRAAERLRASGAHATSTPVDVSDPSSVDRLVEQTLDVYGAIDILVNNAGLAGANGPFLDLDYDTWKAVLDVNLSGVFLCGRAVGRAMVAKQTRGRIVNIGSLNSFSAQKQAAAYAASKGGVLMLTKAMAVDLACFDILVNCLVPGSVLVERNNSHWSTEPLRTALSKAIPLGGPGTVEQIAAAAAFLASSENSFMTGAALVVDGGYLAYARVE